MARIRLSKPTFTRKASAPAAVTKVKSARKVVQNANGWTWWSWIGNAFYAVLYYGTAVVAATVVYGTRASKAAAPHVGRAARWTGRNTVAGVQKLQNRLRGQKNQTGKTEPARTTGQQKPAVDPAIRASNGAAVRSETPAERDRKNAEFRQKIIQVGQIARKRQESGPGPRAGRSSSMPQNGSRPSAGTQSPTSTGGHDMSNGKSNGNGNGGNSNELFRRIKQAFRPVAQLEPETAWELDFHFQACADLLLFEAEGFSMYGETLDRQVGIDPRIIRQYLEAVEDVTSAVQKLHRVRRAYREMYKAAFEAAESGRVRMPTKPAFWSQTGARR